MNLVTSFRDWVTPAIVISARVDGGRPRCRRPNIRDTTLVVPPGFDRHLLSTLLLAGAKPTQIAAMNVPEPQIEIFKPFGEAFELTKKILFQPFDLKKWCVIGFAAFLANLGGGFNFNYRYNRNSDLKNLPAYRDFIDAMHQLPQSLVVAGAVLI